MSLSTELGTPISSVCMQVINLKCNRYPPQLKQLLVSKPVDTTDLVVVKVSGSQLASVSSLCRRERS